MNYTTDGDTIAEKLLILFEKARFEMKFSLVTTLAVSIVFASIGQFLLSGWVLVSTTWIFYSMMLDYRHTLYKEYVQASIVERKRLIHNEAEEEGVKTKHNYALAALEELREEVQR